MIKKINTIKRNFIYLRLGYNVTFIGLSSFMIARKKNNKDTFRTIRYLSELKRENKINDKQFNYLASLSLSKFVSSQIATSYESSLVKKFNKVINKYLYA